VLPPGARELSAVALIWAKVDCRAIPAALG